MSQREASHPPFSVSNLTKVWRKAPAFRHGDMSHSLLN